MPLSRKISLTAGNNSPWNIPDGVSRLSLRSLWEYKAPDIVNIAGGIITAKSVYTIVDVEGGAAASDDLDTINGGKQGRFLVLKAYHTDRDIVVKHGTGNIYTRAAADITLDSTEKALLLFYDGTNWMDL